MFWEKEPYCSAIQWPQLLLILVKRLNLTKTNQIQSLFTVVSKTQVASNSVGQCYFSTVSTGLGKTKPGMLRSFAAMMLPEVLQIHF